MKSDEKVGFENFSSLFHHFSSLFITFHVVILFFDFSIYFEYVYDGNLEKLGGM